MGPMRRPGKPNEEPDEPLLFDLPLAAGAEMEPAEPEEPPKRSAARRPVTAPEPELPLARRNGPVPVPRTETDDDEEPAPAGEFAGRGSRYAASLADLVIHAAVAVTALLGCRALGVKPALSSAPALATFLLSFSFLYTVLPLAFWGHTPGMAWARLTSRSRDGEPLAFDQTVRRWLGGLLTLLLVGLPLLVSGSGRSLTDLISGSATFPAEGDEA